MSKRVFPHWIEGFLELTKDHPSPELFRKWTAISTLAAGMERKVYVPFRGLFQYTNMYIVLVGPPGTGKTVAIRSGQAFIREHKNLHLAPERITQQAFYSVLEEAKSEFAPKIGEINGTVLESHHSLTCSIDELSIFIKKNDIDFMASLADLYDCREHFSYKTKNAGENYATNVWVNIIGGTTGGQLKDIYSIEAIDLGFTSRLIPVWVDDPIEQDDLFGNEDEPIKLQETKLFKQLYHDFEKISTLHGAFVWSPESQEFLNEWYKNKLEPAPKDPFLRNYCSRRLTHVSKLSMITSAAQSNELVIELSHVQEAKALLEEIETNMDRIVEHLGDNKYYEVQKQATILVAMTYRRTKKPVEEFVLRRLIGKQVPPTLVQVIINELIGAHYIKSVGEAPKRGFLPGEKFSDSIT